MNVAQGRQVLDMWFNHQDTRIEGDAYERVFESNLSGIQEGRVLETRRLLFDKLRGKTIRELDDDPTLQAWAIRMNAETIAGGDYYIIAPEGNLMGVATKGDGTPQKNGWGSTSEIMKGVRVIKNGSLENISREMGQKHKVRNFFNNIVSPNNTTGDVTIDTHAVAAALLIPAGSSALEVGHNFGVGISNSKFDGVDGSYHLYAEAYREAAAELGLLPRQLQSIAWEAIRGFYTNKQRRDKKFIAAQRAIWEQNRKTPEAARQQLLDQNSIKQPFWAD